MTFDVLVTDANQRVALEVIRSLGRRNLTVVAVELDQYSSPLSFASTHLDEGKIIQSYQDGSFREILDESRALIPVSTNTHLKLYGSKLIPSDKSLLPDEDLFRKINRKGSLIEIADDLSINVPETRTLNLDGDYRAELDDVKFPAIVKLSHDEGLYLAPAERYARVSTRAELDTVLDQFRKHNRSVLIQEFIPGSGCGYSGLFDDGALIAGLGHRRLREYPPEGGPSTDCKVLQDSAIKSDATELMDEIGWSGPAMVEFRHHRDTRDYYLMEVNPRYWGSLPLARVSGINLPYVHWCEITGTDFSSESLQPAENARVKLLFADVSSVISSVSDQGAGLFSWIGELLSADYQFGLIDPADMKPVYRYCRQKIMKVFTSGSS